jgi:predicted MPP superfamily phosphohydrolase
MVNYSIDSDHRAEKNYKIVLLSNLHIGQFIGVRHLLRIVEAINKSKSNLIVIASDIFNGCSVKECEKFDEVSMLLHRLQSKDGTIAVSRNHDLLPNDVSFRNFFMQVGITLLDDQYEEYGNLVVIGRKDIIRKKENRLPLS